MKTKTTHTPGQHYYVHEYGGLYHLMVPVGFGDLGALRSIYASTHRAEVATLAAAPDLLEAAKESADSLEDSLNMRGITDKYSIERLRLAKLRAAIAKAEGRTE